MKDIIIESVKDCALVRIGAIEDGHDCWGKLEYSKYKFITMDGIEHIVSNDWYIEHDGKNVTKIHFSLPQQKTYLEELFIPYDTALKLKELGFDEPCLAVHYVNSFNIYTKNRGIKNSDRNSDHMWVCTAPLYQQVFDWFRDVYKLEGITQQAEDFVWYKWKINQYNGNGKKCIADSCEYDIYKEAELACLKKLIEIVKTESHEIKILD